MSNFLDPLLFGIRNLVQGASVYPTRNKLRINGATITDDAANNETVMDIVGGGGGGTPSSTPGAAVSTVGSAGVATTYARGDHVHNLTAATMQTLAAGAGAAWNFNSRELGSVGAPLSPTSAARLSDVSAATTALQMHAPVRALDLGYGIAYTGLVTVAGVTLAANDRYGRAGDGINNGVWVAQIGTHTRATDWPVGRVLRGDCFLVLEGDAYPGELVAHYGAPSTVGTDAPTLDTVNRPETLYGDTTGQTFSNRVEKIRGNALSNRTLIESRSVQHSDSSAATLSRVYHKTNTTAAATPLVGESHAFAFSAGAITVVAQIDFMNSAGVVESFHLRETRSYDSVGAPVLIGTAEELLKPDPNTATAVLSWGTTSVSVVLTAPSALDSRWGVNLQAFEVASP